jgi:hypothetical protein
MSSSISESQTHGYAEACGERGERLKLSFCTCAGVRQNGIRYLVDRKTIMWAHPVAREQRRETCRHCRRPAHFSSTYRPAPRDDIAKEADGW